MVFYVKTIQIWIQKWGFKDGIFGIRDKIRTFGTNIFWETPVFYSITNSVVCCMTMPLKLTFTKELKMPKDEKVDNSESHGERKLNCWELISSLTPEIHQKTFPFLNEFMTWEEVERKMFSSLLDGVQHSLCKISTALLEAKATQERSEAEIQILNFCNFHGSKISKLQELEWVVD